MGARSDRLLLEEGHISSHWLFGLNDSVFLEFFDQLTVGLVQFIGFLLVFSLLQG